MKTWLLGGSSAFSQATLNDLLVFPLMLENESFLAGILGGKNVGTPSSNRYSQAVLLFRMLVRPLFFLLASQVLCPC